jgi:NDP-sugar pyrophosphorylase family protein
MQAVILAGGLGTRLRSVVADRPKPMAGIAGRPFLEYQLEFLKRYNVDDLVLCVGYRHECIRDCFGDGSAWGVRIEYSVEEELLGTAGAIKLAQRHIRGAFLALNGDSFCEVDLRSLLHFHEHRRLAGRASRLLATIALTRIHDPRDYGTVGLDRRQRIVRFAEKSTSHRGPQWINAGVYVLEPEILDRIPSGKKVSLEKETFPALAEGGHLHGYPSDAPLIDIGTPEGYSRFQHFIEERESWLSGAKPL